MNIICKNFFDVEEAIPAPSRGIIMYTPQRTTLVMLLVCGLLLVADAAPTYAHTQWLPPAQITLLSDGLPDVGADKLIGLIFMTSVLLVASLLLAYPGLALGAALDDKSGQTGWGVFATFGGLPGLVIPTLLLLYLDPSVLNICAVVVYGIFVGIFFVLTIKSIP